MTALSRSRAPSVSVLIVTCDHAAFIAEAIESARRQEYPELEIIVADDSSVDGAAEIIADYGRRHPEIVRPVLHRGARSVVDNANRGLAACAGEYVALVDGDDVYLSEKIPTQVAALASSPRATLCYHAVEMFDSTSGDAHVQRGNPARRSAQDLVTCGNFVSTCSSMYRRSGMPSWGFSSELRVAPDWLMAIETARSGSIIYIDQVLARYRRHVGQITNVSGAGAMVYADARRTLEIVERDYPDLAPFVPRGRVNLHHWEAQRRGDAGAGWRPTLEPIVNALRECPGRRGTWRMIAVESGRAAKRRLSVISRRRNSSV